MEKPLGVKIFGVLYLILGIFVFLGFIYLVITDFSAFTLEPYNAGDVIYSAEAADFMVRYGLGPILAIGGILAIPGSILILKETNYKQHGYYLMLISSVCWTLPVIGLITIWYFLRSEVKALYI